MEIKFNTNHPPVNLPSKANLSEHLTVQNSPVLFGCRTGICGTCLCEVENLSNDPIIEAHSEEKELLEIIAPDNKKARLACQLKISGSVKLTYIGS